MIRFSHDRKSRKNVGSIFVRLFDINYHYLKKGYSFTVIVNCTYAKQEQCLAKEKRLSNGEKQFTMINL